MNKNNNMNKRTFVFALVFVLSIQLSIHLAYAENEILLNITGFLFDRDLDGTIDYYVPGSTYGVGITVGNLLLENVTDATVTVVFENASIERAIGMKHGSLYDYDEVLFNSTTARFYQYSGIEKGKTASSMVLFKPAGGVKMTVNVTISVNNIKYSRQVLASTQVNDTGLLVNDYYALLAEDNFQFIKNWRYVWEMMTGRRLWNMTTAQMLNDIEFFRFFMFMELASVYDPDWINIAEMVKNSFENEVPVVGSSFGMLLDLAQDMLQSFIVMAITWTPEIEATLSYLDQLAPLYQQESLLWSERNYTALIGVLESEKALTDARGMLDSSFRSYDYLYSLNYNELGAVMKTLHQFSESETYSIERRLKRARQNGYEVSINTTGHVFVYNHTSISTAIELRNTAEEKVFVRFSAILPENWTHDFSENYLWLGAKTGINKTIIMDIVVPYDYPAGNYSILFMLNSTKNFTEQKEIAMEVLDSDTNSSVYMSVPQTAFVSDVVSVNFSVVHYKPVKKVELYLDNIQIKNWTLDGYSYSFADTYSSNYTQGTYFVFLKLYDDTGYVISRLSSLEVFSTDVVDNLKNKTVGWSGVFTPNYPDIVSFEVYNPTDNDWEFKYAYMEILDQDNLLLNVSKEAFTVSSKKTENISFEVNSSENYPAEFVGRVVLVNYSDMLFERNASIRLGSAMPRFSTEFVSNVTRIGSLTRGYNDKYRVQLKNWGSHDMKIGRMWLQPWCCRWVSCRCRWACPFYKNDFSAFGALILNQSDGLFDLSVNWREANIENITIVETNYDTDAGIISGVYCTVINNYSTTDYDYYLPAGQSTIIEVRIRTPPELYNGMLVNVSPSVWTLQTDWGIYNRNNYTFLGNLKEAQVLTYPGDVDGDVSVNYTDIALITQHYRSKKGEIGYDPNADFNLDDSVDLYDFVLMGKNFWTIIND